jgi:hypothetical protein
MHLVIALIIDPFWIKARKEGSYLQNGDRLFEQKNKIQVSSSPPDFGVLRRPPPYRCYPVDGLRLGLRVLIRLIFIC